MVKHISDFLAQQESPSLILEFDSKILHRSSGVFSLSTLSFNLTITDRLGSRFHT
jgi:hypothetical protein